MLWWPGRTIRWTSILPSRDSYRQESVEKLILWELEHLSLIDESLSKDQHAFRKGYSTESGLSDFVDDIESAIYRGQYTLGVLLDIKCALDFARHSAIINGMINKNFPANFVKWYEQYLTSRTATTTVHGHSCTVKVKHSTPQGGILSPLAWNIVFEGFLSEMKKANPVHI